MIVLDVGADMFQNKFKTDAEISNKMKKKKSPTKWGSEKRGRG